VEELLAERGVVVSDQTIGRWCQTLGPLFADGLRRRRARPGDKGHIDEVQLKINGRKHWLWWAVDQDGVGLDILDILVQCRRNQEAAEVFLHRLVKGCGYAPRVAIIDTLASSPGAVRRVVEVLRSVWAANLTDLALRLVMPSEDLRAMLPVQPNQLL
jgi:putative transposase